jgi:O-antigen/teichoic acid export membrane protein
MLLSLLPVSISGVITAYYSALRMQRYQLWFTIGQTATEALLLAVFGSLFGLSGLVLSAIVVAVLYQAARLLYLFRARPELKFRVRDLMGYDEFDSYLISGVKAHILRRIKNIG